MGKGPGAGSSGPGNCPDPFVPVLCLLGPEPAGANVASPQSAPSTPASVQLTRAHHLREGKAQQPHDLVPATFFNLVSKDTSPRTCGPAALGCVSPDMPSVFLPLGLCSASSSCHFCRSKSHPKVCSFTLVSQVPSLEYGCFRASHPSPGRHLRSQQCSAQRPLQD